MRWAQAELLFVLVLFEDGQGLFTALVFGEPPGLGATLRATWHRLFSMRAVQSCCCIDESAGRSAVDELLLEVELTAGTVKLDDIAVGRSKK